MPWRLGNDVSNSATLNVFVVKRSSASTSLQAHATDNPAPNSTLQSVARDA